MEAMYSCIYIKKIPLTYFFQTLVILIKYFGGFKKRQEEGKNTLQKC